MSLEMSIPELAEALLTGEYVLDVREESEFSRGHVPGAVNIPLGQLSRRLKELPAEGHLNVICQSGVRSLRAAEYLLEEGREAHSIAGGTAEWIASGGAIE
ncbi:MAG: rhodanese-like domain-containing protein [Microbacteriaceae bacterium]